MNLKQLIKKAPWKQAQAQDFGPNPDSGYPVSQDNPHNLPRLLNCTVTLRGSQLSIDNNDMGIVLNLNPDQIQQLIPQFQAAEQTPGEQAAANPWQATRDSYGDPQI